MVCHGSLLAGHMRSLSLMRCGYFRIPMNRLLARDVSLCHVVGGRPDVPLGVRFSSQRGLSGRSDLAVAPSLGVSTGKRRLVIASRRPGAVSSDRIIRTHSMTTRLRRSLEMSLLLRRRGNVALLRNLPFMRRRLGSQATTASIETNAVAARRPEPTPVRKGMANARAGNIIGRRVVGEMVPFPTPAVITMSPVAVAVIDTAIKSASVAPIALVKKAGVSRPSPPTRRPQQPDSRWINPRARHPVILSGSIVIGPVTWRPEVAIPWTRWLEIHQKWRR